MRACVRVGGGSGGWLVGVGVRLAGGTCSLERAHGVLTTERCDAPCCGGGRGASSCSRVGHSVGGLLCAVSSPECDFMLAARVRHSQHHSMQLPQRVVLLRLLVWCC